MYKSNLTFPSEMYTPAQRHQSGTVGSVSRDLLGYFESYAREKPTTVALCALGVGFVLGWKLKPW